MPKGETNPIEQQHLERNPFSSEGEGSTEANTQETKDHEMMRGKRLNNCKTNNHIGATAKPEED
eukprot:14384645-Alexandrium_andersonii.AAC.1